MQKEVQWLYVKSKILNQTDDRKRLSSSKGGKELDKDIIIRAFKITSRKIKQYDHPK